MPKDFSADESKELAELAAKKGVINYVGFNNTQNPANAYVRELVQSGKFGQIMLFIGRYDQDQLLAPTFLITWRHINKLAGCGALGDLGSHLLSVSQFIMGDRIPTHDFRKVFLNPLHKGYSAFQPAGGIAIAYNDMKVLEAHELFSAITKDTAYDCTFEFGYKIDRTVAAILKSAKERTWGDVK